MDRYFDNKKRNVAQLLRSVINFMEERTPHYMTLKNQKIIDLMR